MITIKQLQYISTIETFNDKLVSYDMVIDQMLPLFRLEIKSPTELVYFDYPIRINY